MPRRHRLTRREYYRLGEVGILRRQDRVELLEGQLVDTSPIGPRHASVTENLNELLVTAFAGRAGIRCQLPVVLDDGSKPQPDEIFLLIEGADSSLDVDRTIKLELYARAGIRAMWIVDRPSDGVLVHRRPSGGGYGSVVRGDAPGMLDVEALPGVTIPVAAVFAQACDAARLCQRPRDGRCGA